MAESDRYVRIASRTQDENKDLVTVLGEILASETPDFYLIKRI